MEPDVEKGGVRLAAAPIRERWVTALMRQAPLEFARVVYGLGDCAHGRVETGVAAAVRRAEQQGVSVTRERAEQRARAYLPVSGHEHCPRCWVLSGAKNPLHMAVVREDEGLETARCPHCSAEYVNAL